MGLNAVSKRVTPTDRKGIWDLAPNATVDGVFVVQVGSEKYKLQDTGPYRASYAGVYTGATGIAAKLQAVLDHADIKEILFDEKDGSIDISGSTITVPAGKKLIFKNGCKLVGTGTLIGGIIECNELDQCFATSLNVEKLQNKKISVAWFGAKCDHNYNMPYGASTDNYLPIMNAIKATGDIYEGIEANYQATGKVYIPAPRGVKYYYVSETIVIDRFLDLYGDGMDTSILLFPPGTAGIKVIHPYGGQKGGHAHKIHDLGLRGNLGPGEGSTEDDDTSHGLIVQAGGGMYENIRIVGFNGDGLFVYGTAPADGNANNNLFRNIKCYLNSGSGVHAAGADGNNNVFEQIDSYSNAEFGVKDRSFLGNKWHFHTAANATENTKNRSSVSHGGNLYYCIQTHTNIEPGVAPGWENYWEFNGLGQVDIFFKAWNPAKTYVPGGSHFFEGDNQKGLVLAGYTEFNQWQGKNASGTIFFNGLSSVARGSFVLKSGIDGIHSNGFAAEDIRENVNCVMLGEGHNIIGFRDIDFNFTLAMKYIPTQRLINFSEGNSGGSAILTSSYTPPAVLGRNNPPAPGMFGFINAFFRSETGMFNLIGVRTTKPAAGPWESGDYFINTGLNRSIAGWIYEGGTWVTLFRETTPKTLLDGNAIEINAAEASEWHIMIEGNRTIGNPTNAEDGMKLILRIKQDAIGNRTVTWGSKYRFSTDAPQPTLSTGAGYTDYVSFKYNAADDTWDCLGSNCGFAPVVLP